MLVQNDLTFDRSTEYIQDPNSCLWILNISGNYQVDLFIPMDFRDFFSCLSFQVLSTRYHHSIKEAKTRTKIFEYPKLNKRDQTMKLLNSTEINPILKDFTENYSVPTWMVINFYLVFCLATILAITCCCVIICQFCVICSAGCAKMCENWNRCCGDCCNCCTVCLLGSSENCTACTIRYKEFVANRFK